MDQRVIELAIEALEARKAVIEESWHCQTTKALKRKKGAQKSGVRPLFAPYTGSNYC
jgi:hypothetical protein